MWSTPLCKFDRTSSPVAQSRLAPCERHRQCQSLAAILLSTCGYIGLRTKSPLHRRNCKVEQSTREERICVTGCISGLVSLHGRLGRLNCETLGYRFERAIRLMDYRDRLFGGCSNCDSLADLDSGSSAEIPSARERSRLAVLKVRYLNQRSGRLWVGQHIRFTR